MTQPTYSIVKLAPGMDVGAFDCGEDSYNLWLTGHAAKSVESGASMVYLFIESKISTEQKVVGYFAICPTLVVRDDMPKPLQRNLRSTPAWLLAKLALDRSLRWDSEKQWGWQLLRVALETIIEAVPVGGGQVIVVDADNPGLIGWYTHNGFKPTGGNDLRLYMKVATARKYLLDN